MLLNIKGIMIIQSLEINNILLFFNIYNMSNLNQLISVIYDFKINNIHINVCS